MDEILSHSMDFGCPFMQSLPARGARIEIRTSRSRPTSRSSRSPQGERGLKCWRGVGAQSEDCRSPQGERGLKYGGYGGYCLKFVSLPARGAWIEIRRGASPPQ